ncbi:YciI family protein [soil metagenome]
MKVIALIYGDEGRWDSFSEEERSAVYEQYRTFGQKADGKVLDGAELAPTRSATTVRVRDGETIVTDGPFAETKEQLGGFYLLECESFDEAAQLAAQIPGASTGAVEVRIVADEGSS